MKCKSYKILQSDAKGIDYEMLKKIRERNSKGGKEQEDLLFICLVCSLQQRSLQII